MGAVSTHQYYLVGIPGESPGDWREFESEFLSALAISRKRHWLTLGTFTPIPGTPWADEPGAWSQDVSDRIAAFKARLVDLNRGGIRAILATARSRHLHDAEVVTMRAAVRAPGALGRFLSCVRPSEIGDGRWRDRAATAGLSVRDMLSAPSACAADAAG